MKGQLPQYGDAVKAARVLNERTNAAVGIGPGDEMVTTGPLVITPDGVSGPGLPALLAVYGDLFDVDETLNEAGIARLVGNHERDVQEDEESLPSALVAVALQCIACPRRARYDEDTEQRLLDMRERYAGSE